MFSAVRAASKVVSIRDVDYQLPVDDTFHPSCLKGAIKRLSNRYDSLRHILPIVMKSDAAKGVWGVVFEKENNPYLVFSNLKYTNVRPQYRRILRVNLDNIPRKMSNKHLQKFTIVNDKYVSAPQEMIKNVNDDSEKTEADDDLSESNEVVHFENLHRNIAVIMFLLLAIFIANAFIASNLQVLVSKNKAT